MIGIVSIDISLNYFICYTSTEAFICCYKYGIELIIVHRFFKTIAIKSILDKLFIKKIEIHTSNNQKLTIIVLLNDQSIYIYENILFDRNDSWFNSIALTKHIHPIERFYSHINGHDSNNSKFIL